MGAKGAVFGITCGLVAAVGSAVLIVMGHRPWYAWTTLATGIGTVWTIWSVRRANLLAARVTPRQSSGT